MALEHDMIKPFGDRQVRAGMISYGVSSYGYDLRISDEFKIFTNINNTIVDPKAFDPRSFVDFRGEVGIIPNVTPFEPEWEGFVTLEISNTTPLPAKIYANEGIAQVLFFESDEVCETSYADRKGKYQGQQGIVLPRL